jgi:hypothetical protein
MRVLARDRDGQKGHEDRRQGAALERCTGKKRRKLSVRLYVLAFCKPLIEMPAPPASLRLKKNSVTAAGVLSLLSLESSSSTTLSFVLSQWLRRQETDIWAIKGGNTCFIATPLLLRSLFTPLELICTKL